jgi:uncharacterized repeat protein (TIGR04138 family)
MHTSNFDGTLEQILKQDPRYHRDAYLFLRESLDFTQKTGPKSGKQETRPAASAPEPRKPREGEEQHVTGQELLQGIRAFALETFGPMTLTVFNEWGIRRCEDFGEIVFNMVEHNLLGKTDKDSRDDFKGGYDFEQAFRQPFLPSGRVSAPPEEAKPSGT